MPLSDLTDATAITLALDEFDDPSSSGQSFPVQLEPSMP